MIENDLCLVHVDFSDQRHERFQSAEALAPRRTCLAKRYFCCETPTEFAQLMCAAQGCVIVLLHENDRLAALKAFDLVSRLQQKPTCWTVLYSGFWANWGACSLEQVLRSVGDSLPVSSWQQTWAAMPWSFLKGHARPLAWLGHLQNGNGMISLRLLCERFPCWIQEACEQVILTVPLDDPASFFREIASVYLRMSLLKHVLDGEGHPRTREHRFEKLLEAVDNLWLLQGIADHKGWDEPARRLEKGRIALEELLGCPRCPPSDVLLRDEDRPFWTRTIEVIEDLLKPTGSCP